jgi:hypothetical protein
MRRTRAARKGRTFVNYGSLHFTPGPAHREAMRPVILKLLTLLLLGAAAGAAARPNAGQPPAGGSAVAAGSAQAFSVSGMTLDQAVAMVSKQFAARVVRAETKTVDGRTLYVLRLLNDQGRVWTVRVDAASGAVL